MTSIPNLPAGNAEWLAAVRRRATLHPPLPRTWAAWKYPAASGLLRGKLPSAPPLHMSELQRPVCPSLSPDAISLPLAPGAAFRFACSRAAGHTGRHAAYRTAPSDPRRVITAVWEDQ